jgi:hypothetical protein
MSILDERKLTNKNDFSTLLSNSLDTQHSYLFSTLANPSSVSTLPVYSTNAPSNLHNLNRASKNFNLPLSD